MRMDAKGEGQISLMSMRRVLTEEAQLHMPKPKRGSGMKQAASTPNLTPQPALSEEEKLLTAFKEADKDGSGNISKREMFGMLERLGIDRHSNCMKLFKGFDVDDDGVITFLEFKKIAAAL